MNTLQVSESKIWLLSKSLKRLPTLLKLSWIHSLVMSQFCTTQLLILTSFGLRKQEEKKLAQMAQVDSWCGACVFFFPGNKKAIMSFCWQACTVDRSPGQYRFPDDTKRLAANVTAEWCGGGTVHQDALASSHFPTLLPHYKISSVCYLLVTLACSNTPHAQADNCSAFLRHFQGNTLKRVLI